MSILNICNSLSKPSHTGTLASCNHRRPPRYSVRRLSITVKGNKDGHAGIHDPAGPHGAAWGSGLPKGGKNQAAQEDKMVQSSFELDKRQHRSDQKHHKKGPGHISNVARDRIDNEIEEVESEAQSEVQEGKAQYASDEEYAHMGRLQKWFMEAKATLYEFLKSGVEPL